MCEHSAGQTPSKTQYSICLHHRWMLHSWQLSYVFNYPADRRKHEVHTALATYAVIPLPFPTPIHLHAHAPTKAQACTPHPSPRTHAPSLQAPSPDTPRTLRLCAKSPKQNKKRPNFRVSAPHPHTRLARTRVLRARSLRSSRAACCCCLSWSACSCARPTLALCSCAAFTLARCAACSSLCLRAHG